MSGDVLSTSARAKLFDILIKSVIAAVLSASVSVQTWAVLKIFEVEKHNALQDATFVRTTDLEPVRQLTTVLQTNQVQVMATQKSMLDRQDTLLQNVAENKIILEMLKEKIIDNHGSN